MKKIFFDMIKLHVLYFMKNCQSKNIFFALSKTSVSKSLLHFNFIRVSDAENNLSLCISRFFSIHSENEQLDTRKNQNSTTTRQKKFTGKVVSCEIYGKLPFWNLENARFFFNRKKQLITQFIMVILFTKFICPQDPIGLFLNLVYI